MIRKWQPNIFIGLQMVGEGFSIVKLLQMAIEVKPLCIVVGTHHFVQMSELDFQSEGINKKDISSVLWITPVGATVPPITSINLRKKFPNMAVSLSPNHKMVRVSHIYPSRVLTPFPS